MKTYDLYGLPSVDIEIVRQAIEAALGVKLVAHDSSFKGEYYSGGLNDEVFEIWGNRDPIDGELHNDALPPPES